ncbi:MAG: hypothetical protein ABIE74_05545 [Pseudomonadota bacterium]
MINNIRGNIRLLTNAQSFALSHNHPNELIESPEIAENARSLQSLLQNGATPSLEIRSIRRFIELGPLSVTAFPLPDTLTEPFSTLFAPLFPDATRDLSGYLRVPQALRSAHIDRLLYISIVGGLIAQGAFGRGDELLYDNVETFLQNIAQEIKVQYLEDGALPAGFVEELHELLGRGAGVQVMRLGLNITSANKVEQKGYLAQRFIETALYWLRDVFKNSIVYKDPAGTMFNVVFTGKMYVGDVEKELSSFGRSVKEKLEDNVSPLRIPDKDRVLSEFNPTCKAFMMNVASLSESERSNERLAEKIREIQIRLVSALSYFEEHGDSTGDAARILYTDDQLPPDSDATWKKYPSRRIGLVGDLPYDGVQRNDELDRLTLPPFYTGEINGVMNRLSGGFASFVSDTRSVEATEVLVGHIANLIHLGIEAMYTATYPRILKNSIYYLRPELPGTDEHFFENSNFFAQELALKGYSYLSLFEYDNFRQHMKRISRRDFSNRDFNRVMELWFERFEAEENEMPIIMAFKGDLIAVSFDATDEKQAAWMIRQVQRGVRNEFRTRFQIAYKLKYHLLDQNGEPTGEVETMRIPLWVAGRYTRLGSRYYRFRISKFPYRDYRPLKVPLTITALYHQLEKTLKSEEDRKWLVTLLHDMGDAVEAAKGQRGVAPILSIGMDVIREIEALGGRIVKPIPSFPPVKEGLLCYSNGDKVK